VADGLVLDTSAYLSFFLKKDQSKGIERLLESHPLFAPDLFWFEAANGVLFAKRSHRFGIKEVSLPQLLEIVKEFPVKSIPIPIWWKKAVHLVQKHDLTFYDSAYVACAQVLNLPLLTLDRKVIQVSKEEDVALAWQ